MSLRYSDHTPDSLVTSPFTAALLAVLDGVQSHKEETIHTAHRFYNPVLLTDKKQLVKKVNDLGWQEVSEDFPLSILTNMVLNYESVFRLRGSKLGIEHFLRVLTDGEPTIDDSQFYPKPGYIILNDLEAGYLFSAQDYPNNTKYLFSGVDNFNPRFLYITVATPYYQNDTLIDYINKFLKEFLTFTDSNTTIAIRFINGVYVPNPHAYQFFVNKASRSADSIILLLTPEAGSGNTVSFMINGDNGIIDWGDGSGEEPYTAGVLTHTYGNSTQRQVVVTYGAHASILDLSNRYTITVDQIAGALPSTLLTLDVSFNNLKLLPKLPAGLERLNASKNQLISVPNVPTKLSNIDLSYNNLTSDEVCRHVYALSTYAVSNGTYKSNNQVPQAILSYAPINAIAAKATLETRGWTVLTD